MNHAICRRRKDLAVQRSNEEQNNVSLFAKSNLKGGGMWGTCNISNNVTLYEITP